MHENSVTYKQYVSAGQKKCTVCQCDRVFFAIPIRDSVYPWQQVLQMHCIVINSLGLEILFVQVKRYIFFLLFRQINISLYINMKRVQNLTFVLGLFYT